MLVRALGYTARNNNEIEYQRALVHAARAEVALIGRYVETKGFDFDKIASDYELTRNDMAMLLYNFLLSDYYEYKPVRNPITGMWQNEEVYTSVLQNFGIEKVEGYVTGVSNYAATLNVANAAGNLVELEGTVITERSNNEVEIMGVTIARPILETKAALGLDEEFPGYEGDIDLLGRKIVVFRHTGRSTNRELPKSIVAGNKTDVTYYENKARFNTNRDEVIEFELGVGDNKTDLYNQRGPFNVRDLDFASNFYRLGGGRLAATISLETLDLFARYTSSTLPVVPVKLTAADGATPAQIAVRDEEIKKVEEYRKAWEDARDARNAGTANTQGTVRRAEFEFARLIDATAETKVRNYRLIYVDNGVGLDGEDDFFYIYFPLSAGYVTRSSATELAILGAGAVDGDPDGARIGTENAATSGTWAFERVNNPGGFVVRTIEGGPAGFDKDKAYMFANLGANRRDVTVFRELDLIREDVQLVGRDTRQMRFEGSSNLPVTFPVEGRERALSARTTAPDNLGARFNVYGDAGTPDVPYLARIIKPFDAPGMRYDRFAVVMAANSVTPNVAITEFLFNGRSVRRHRIVDSATGVASTVLIASPDGVGYGAPLFAGGAIIGMRGRADNTFFEAVPIVAARASNNLGAFVGSGLLNNIQGVTTNPVPAGQWGLTGDVITSMHATNFGSAGLGLSAVAGAPNASNEAFATDRFNAARNVMSLSGKTIGSRVYGVSDARSFTVNAGTTRFIVVSHDGEEFGVARNALDAEAMIVGAVRNILVISSGTPANPGAVKTAFIITDAATVGGTKATPRFGIVVPNPDRADKTTRDTVITTAWDSLQFNTEYNIVDVYDYSTNTFVKAATTASLTNVGTLVKILDTTLTNLVGAPGTFHEITAANIPPAPLSGAPGLRQQTSLMSGFNGGALVTAFTANNAGANYINDPNKGNVNLSKTYAGNVTLLSENLIVVAGAPAPIPLTVGSRLNILHVRQSGGTAGAVTADPATWGSNAQIGWGLVVPNGEARTQIALSASPARAIVTTDDAGAAIAVTIVIAQGDTERLPADTWGNVRDPGQWFGSYTAPTPAAPPAPPGVIGATVNNGTISGQVGLSIGTPTIDVTLQGGLAFASQGTLELTRTTNSPINGERWILNLPTGITVSAITRVSETVARLTLAGTSTVTSSAALSIVVPTEALAIGEAILVTPNPSRVWSIVAPGAAAAATDDLVVDVGDSIWTHTITLTFTSGVLAANASASASGALDSWVTNLPDGMSARALAAILDDDATVDIRIEGTPTTAFTGPIDIVVPTGAFRSPTRWANAADVAVTWATQRNFVITTP
jgi:hypothetical protein